MNQSNARLLTMIAGWFLAYYGVRRRDWQGTILAMTGIVMANGAITLGKFIKDDLV